MVRQILTHRLESPLKRLEDQLERSGKWKAAQRLRKKQHQWGGLSKEQWESLQKFLNFEEDRHIAAQREIALRQEREELWKRKESNSGPAEMEVIEHELSEIKRRQGNIQSYCNAMDEARGGLEKCLRDTPIWRALVFRRRHPKWYFSSAWLRLHCVAMGGCCARGCGCCDKPRDTDRPEILGHCTVACSCCDQVRGYHITIKDGFYPGRITCDVRLEESDTFSGLMMNAYFWGL